MKIDGVSIISPLKLPHPPGDWQPDRTRCASAGGAVGAGRAGRVERGATLTIRSMSGVENRRSGFSLPVGLGLRFRVVASVRFGLALFPVCRVGQWRGPGFE